MTISASRINELNIQTIIQRAYQVTGLMNANETAGDPNWAAKFAMAADFLDVELKGLQANAVISRHRIFHTVPVVAGTRTYTIAAASSILDFVGQGMFKVTGSDIETPVSPIDQDVYQSIPDKLSTGTPVSFYFQRGDTSIVYLWPVPTDSGTLTIVAHQLIADGTDQSKTVDLERHWTKYLIYQLAHWLSLSNNLPIATIGKFESLAEKQFKVAKGYSQSGIPGQIYVSHRTGWN